MVTAEARILENMPQDKESARERFHQLQALLPSRWRSIDYFDRSPRQILVVPSLSLDQEELSPK